MTDFPTIATLFKAFGIPEEYIIYEIVDLKQILLVTYKYDNINVCISIDENIAPKESEPIFHVTIKINNRKVSGFKTSAEIIFYRDLLKILIFFITTIKATGADR